MATQQRTRVALIIVTAAAVLVTLLTGTVLAGRWAHDPCAPVRTGSSQPPAAWSDVAGLAIGFGYESIAEDTADLPAATTRMDLLDPDAVSLSAGRPDWTTFPWPGHKADWSGPVRAHRCDLLDRAMDALGTRPDGSRRARILVVDAHVGGWIAQDPSIAGVAADGTRSTLQASLSQYESGPVGDQLVALVAEVATRYEPEAISLTELFADRYTFGDDDLVSFRAYTGDADWPRDTSGAIDQDSPQIASWRSEVLAAVAGRASEAAHQGGSSLLFEVRVNWSRPTAGRADSGQDYDLLLGAVDQLVAWDYFALSGDQSPEAVERAVRARERRWPGRWVSSLGLWAKHGETADPDDVALAAAGAFDGGSMVVWVTPASMMSDAHWQALAEVPGPTG